MLSLNSVQDLDRWIAYQKRHNRFDASDAERKPNQCVWWNSWLIRACGDQYFVKTAPYGCVLRQQAAEVAPWVVDELKIRMNAINTLEPNEDELKNAVEMLASMPELAKQFEEQAPDYCREVLKLGIAQINRAGGTRSTQHVREAIGLLPDGEWNITAMRVK